MKFWLTLGVLVLGTPLVAESVWILKTGPIAVTSIPLQPVQMVSAWRGQYSDGTDTVWVYATRSPQFFLPKGSDGFLLEGTPWTAVFFFPGGWKAADRKAWFERWMPEFLTLYSLPEPGYPIVFPSILRKG